MKIPEAQFWLIYFNEDAKLNNMTIFCCLAMKRALFWGKWQQITIFTSNVLGMCRQTDRPTVPLTEVLRQEAFQCWLEFILKYVLKTLFFFSMMIFLLCDVTFWHSGSGQSWWSRNLCRHPASPGSCLLKVQRVLGQDSPGPSVYLQWCKTNAELSFTTMVQPLTWKFIKLS